jgi:hypothetical protein
VATAAGLAACAVWLVGGASTVAGADAAGLRTTDSVYRVFSSTGGVSLHTSSESGSCFSGSETAERSDAWRCAVGNGLYDPCFSSAQAPGLVVCPAAPWLSTGVTIRLTAPLPTAEANRAAPSVRTQPWALELYDGSRCLFDGGATAAIGGRRLNYFCGARAKTGLWGYPGRTTEPWRIYAAPFAAKHLSERVAIRDAWS